MLYLPFVTHPRILWLSTIQSALYVIYVQFTIQIYTNYGTGYIGNLTCIWVIDYTSQASSVPNAGIKISFLQAISLSNPDNVVFIEGTNSSGTYRDERYKPRQSQAKTSQYNDKHFEQLVHSSDENCFLFLARTFALVAIVNICRHIGRHCYGFYIWSLFCLESSRSLPP